MRLLAATVASVVALVPLGVSTVERGDLEAITVARVGTESSAKAPAEHFTGSVRVDYLFRVAEPSRVSSASVTFEPGARTAWHTHPLGQRLVVTAGCGWVQQWGAPVQVIRPGDVVHIPPGRKHWHGATATTGMTHIAIQEERDGKIVEWMEKVSDEQYPAGSGVER